VFKPELIAWISLEASSSPAVFSENVFPVITPSTDSAYIPPPSLLALLPLNSHP